MNIKAQMILATEYDSNTEKKCTTCEGGGLLIELNQEKVAVSVPCSDCGGEGFTE